MVVHLVGGETVGSRVLKPDEAEKASDLPDFVKHCFKEDASWYLSVELDRPGSEAIIPGDKILYVEVQS